MKRTLLFVLACVLIGTYAMAVNPTADIYKTDDALDIDGEFDEIYENVEPNSIDQPGVNMGTNPTIGDPGTSYWKAVWDGEGMYIIVFVNDDVFFPSYEGADEDNPWNYDKVEIYFDVNEVLADGGKWKDGHYQVAPGWDEDLIDGELQHGDPTAYWGRLKDVDYAFKVDGSTYTLECYIPFSKFTDLNGNPMVLTRPIGFDVYVNDCDAEGYTDFAAWGEVNESSLDGAGIITLKDDGVPSSAHIISQSNTTVYPNPVSSELSFSGEVSHVSVMNLLGQEVENFGNAATRKINVDNLKSGIYFVRFLDSKGIESSHKVIKK